jgi:lysozyme
MKDKLVRQLRRDEGEVLHAYQDHLGYWTIGVGILIDKRKGGGITKDESTYLLNNRIDEKEAELLEKAPWTATLSPVRFGVLLNMSFQMGVEGVLKFKNTLKMIRDGDYEGAADGMMNSLWAKQTPERAARLAAQMREDVWK